MKKENFGVPAALLKVMLYVLALFVAVNSGYSIWVMIAAVIAVFALGFDSSVKKTAVQAAGLVLLFVGVKMVFDFFGYFFSFADGVDYTGESVYSKYNDVVGVIDKILNITAYVLFVILGLMAMVKKDLFVSPVHKAVDGFVPTPQYAQPQQYAQQQYNGQPQQYAQPQNFNPQTGQPMQAQNFNPQTGQPMQSQQPGQPNQR